MKAPRPPLIGAHVSIGGGVARAPVNGQAIGAQAIQLFTRNQRQWRAPALGSEAPAAFREALRSSGITSTLSHASYLINLASVSDDFLTKSRDTMVDEVERCALLGIPWVVVHPGAHMGAGEEAGITTVVESLDFALTRTDGLPVGILLEGTAGQGTCLGYRFEHLAAMIARVRAPERVGVCLDTCHLIAAGFDIATPAGYERTMADFGRLVGFTNLKAIHLNDAREGLGSRRDRHAPAGTGCLGVETFRRVVNDPRLAGLPMVVENEGPEPEWRAEIALLRGLVAPAAAAGPRRRTRAT